MKDRPDAILRGEQARYLDSLLPPRDGLRTRMEAWAAEHDVPIADPEVGKLLGILARAVSARRILEIGTAIGYGTLWLAEAAPEARVVTVDRDRERQQRAREFLTEAGVADRVELVEGDALAVLDRTPGPFDLAFLDADKLEYRRCLDRVLPLLRVGGLVVVDNLLWKGRIAEPTAIDDPEADAIERFNGYFMIHPQLQSLVLPLGDGVGVGSKLQPLITELGGPF